MSFIILKVIIIVVIAIIIVFAIDNIFFCIYLAA